MAAGVVAPAAQAAPGGAAPDRSSSSSSSSTVAARAAAPPGPEDPVGLLVPSAAEISELATQVPKDPVEAARRLVAAVYGDDPRLAVVATAELLRRAGIPLVSADGPVIAMPDGLTAANQPTYVELLPILTRSVRAGEGYEPGRVAALLEELSITDGLLTDEQLTRLLAAWGKATDVVPESQLAGAAIRASSWQRGQLLMPGQEGLHLDALQSYLLISQVTAEDEVPDWGAPHGLRNSVGNSVGHAVGHAAGKSSCGEFAESWEAAKKDNPKSVKGVKKAFTYTLTKAATEAGVSEKTIGTIKSGLKKFNTISAGLGAFLLIHGTVLNITDDTGGTIHFRGHKQGPRDVTFTATAWFWSPLAQDELHCYALAGVKVPPNGPLTDKQGFSVAWMSSEKRSGENLLQAKKGEGRKFGGSWGGGSDPLNSEGKSNLTEYPRTEAQPDKEFMQAVHKKRITMYAQLMQRTEWKSWGDIIGLLNIQSLAIDAFRHLGLPDAAHPFVVEYHAPDAYVIKANTSISFPPSVSATMSADLLSCAGLGGRWQGSYKIHAEAGPGLEMVKQMFKASGSDERETSNDHVTFAMDDTIKGPMPILLDGPLQLLLDMNNHPAEGEHIDGVVGRGTWTSDGDLNGIAGSGWPFQSGATFHIVGVPKDKRCPGASLEQDKFDDE